MIHTAQVAIVGAGPVGLCLALDLAWRGIDVVVVEQHPEGQPPSVKCNHIASRTMEAFRRLGFVDKVRAVGLPDDYPNDVVLRTAGAGYELMRIHIPCRRDRYTDKSGPDGWWPTPEPAHRVNQIYFEPVLFAEAKANPRITILNHAEVIEVGQDAGGVRLIARDLGQGGRIEVTADYLVGCDGGRSMTRKAIGAKLHGDEVIQRVQSSFIRAPGLIDRVTKPDAWMSYIYNPERAGNLVAIDGREMWLVHNYLLDHEEGFDTVDRDACIRRLLGVDAAFEYELLAKEDWIGRRLVVDKLREGRIFISGDAAHLWVPYAGFGMNAGIADALNLSWMLAAHLNGWAPAAILDGYENERLPITDQVSRFAMSHARGAIAERTSVPAALEDDTFEGEASRQAVGEAAYRLHIQQFACAGLNYGYYYPDSMLIAYDGEPQPAYTMHDYTPSTVPGCRLPHLWLGDGGSLYDRLGPDYTLLRFDRAVPVDRLLDAAAERGVPVALLDLAFETLPAPYRHALCLCRPDGHVAWRGDAVPDRCDDLIGIIAGYGQAVHEARMLEA
ncbi:FAD-dependent oxidoreductase [Sphingomonas sp. MMS24-J13]|uniref:FAD-dependent oxidoreductase n=1 Tax=Sphingomonas sp. MMS24-J13 TaxID=3238686 RepID=UPI00384CC036